MIFWTLFIGIGAMGGGIGMLLDPSGKAMGMDPLLPAFQVLPFADILFQNLNFSGIALILVNGVPNLIAVVLLFRKRKEGIVLGGVLGITLMLWICIQFYIFPVNFMDIIYFIFGFLQAITGYATGVFNQQERFVVNIGDYRNIGSNPSRLVIFFSRMGYTRKAAYEAANESGAEVFEIKTTEPTGGTSGFFWCGWFALHRREMSIEKMPDISRYEHLTICSPIWVFGLSSPILSFCRQAKGQVKSVDYILVHFRRAGFPSVGNKMDKILGVHREKQTDICYRVGKKVFVRQSKDALN